MPLSNQPAAARTFFLVALFRTLLDEPILVEDAEEVIFLLSALFLSVP